MNVPGVLKRLPTLRRCRNCYQQLRSYRSGLNRRATATIVTNDSNQAPRFWEVRLLALTAN
eukprot:475330-Rhodomonas_salina.1